MTKTPLWLAAALAAALLLSAGCQSGRPDDGASSSLSVDARNWSPEAIARGGAAAGVVLSPVKSEQGSGLYAAEGVEVSYETEGGHVNVRVKTTSKEMAGKAAEIANGIGMALVPKDKIRKARPSLRHL